MQLTNLKNSFFIKLKQNLKIKRVFSRLFGNEFTRDIFFKQQIFEHLKIDLLHLTNVNPSLEKFVFMKITTQYYTLMTSQVFQRLFEFSNQFEKNEQNSQEQNEIKLENSNFSFNNKNLMKESLLGDGNDINIS